MNRLASSSSPYLRQHKDNPVHWQPWDEAALRQAADEDKPIFLSVGYSSCHWCHVMEHESFEDGDVAALLNSHFICIKVDREEKPDVDETYMTAVQIANGHGGWPMSLFLTPDLRPFWAGTYLPKEDRGPHPGFRTLIRYMADVWRLKRDEIEHAAGEYEAALREAISADIGSPGTPDFSEDLVTRLLDGAVSAAKSQLENEGKPKFPPHSMLRLLLWLAEHRGREDALDIASKVLDAMMLGGIHDHVGGGFHRYSTDQRWFLPHFEKMLYDNALLLRNYADAHRTTGNEEYKRVCERLVAWAEREVLSPEGIFYSALDADSEGEEGKCYVWKHSELPFGEDFNKTYGIEKKGNFRDEATGDITGDNILSLKESVGSLYDAQLEQLLQTRQNRTKPTLDDKCLIAWNGLMISGLCAFGKRDLAVRCADAILAKGSLPHQIVGGKPEGLPFLDQSYFIEGLLDLAEASGRSEYRDEAQKLYKYALPQFHDESGGWFFTGPQHQELFGRSRPITDSATPSPSAVMTRCALRLGDTEVARKDITRSIAWLDRAPTACSSMLQVVAMYATSVSTPKVVIKAAPSESKVDNNRVTYQIAIDVPPEWHLNEPPQIRVTGLSEVAIDGMTVSGTPGQNRDGEAVAVVRYQVCNDRECLMPEETEIKLPWYRP